MMDGEKRIVTFMGKGGRLTATIIWRNVFDLFEVECVEEFEDTRIINTTFLKNESEAQAYAEEFVWREKNATV